MPDGAPLLTPGQFERYRRHLTLPELGVEGQRRLLGGRVCLIGAGGLGCPLAQYLAAAGVGTLGIVDFDVVDASNLQRQVLYGTADIGRSKAEVARERIAAMNPDVRVELHPEQLTSKNALEILGAYDVVVDGTDNFPTRYLSNDACVMLGKPNVHGSIFRFEGQATVFDARRGPCYRCLFPEPPPPGPVPSCGGGRPRRAAGADRARPGDGDREAPRRHRRAADRPPAPGRCAAHGVPRVPAAEGPGLPGLRREPDHPRAHGRRGLRRAAPRGGPERGVGGCRPGGARARRGAAAPRRPRARGVCRRTHRGRPPGPARRARGAARRARGLAGAPRRRHLPPRDALGPRRADPAAARLRTGREPDGWDRRVVAHGRPVGSPLLIRAATLWARGRRG